VTAETKEVGQSTNARVLFIHVEGNSLPREKIFGAGSEANRRLLPVAMGGYVQWIAQNWETLARDLPKRLEELTNEFSKEGTHARQPGNAALVMLGMETALKFMRDMDAITQAEVDAELAKAREALIQITIEQARSRESKTLRTYS
jgi:hypothetical protein